MHKRRTMLSLICVLLGAISFPAASLAQTKQQVVDTVVICRSDLQDALGPWAEYRRKQGHKIAIRFSRATVEENKKMIDSYARSGELKNVLLVGDAGDRWLDPKKLVPTNIVAAKVNVHFGSEAEIGTDNPYGDLDGDGVPELAVGRLTVDTAEELTATIDRIIRYEKQSSGQPWQRQINLIAGVGGFGRLIDSVVEGATKKIVTELIPAEYETSMTHGSWTSPYFPDPRRFSETAIGRFNEGCLFWVYCGHGNRGQLDRVMLPDQNHRILDNELVDQLNCKSGSPIAICLACYTGAHDGAEDCLAENMMRQPNGPIAVVCGSRITMPYAMSILSVEMMNEYFRGECKTLGELMLRAKQQMSQAPDAENDYRQSLDALGQTFSPRPDLLVAECKEHMHLMQLLGDPLLRLKRPGKLNLELVDADAEEPKYSVGDEVKVAGSAARAGTVLVEIAYQRGRFRERPSFRREYDSSDAAFSKAHEDYLKANNRVCVSKMVHVNQGRFEIGVTVPPDCKGACDVRAMLLGASEVAIDSLPIRVLSDRKTRKKRNKEKSARTARRSGR